MRMSCSSIISASPWRSIAPCRSILVSPGKQRSQACAETAFFPALQYAAGLGVENQPNRGGIFGLLQFHRKLRHAHRQADARWTPQYVLAAFGQAEQPRSPAGENNSSPEQVQHPGMA